MTMNASTGQFTASVGGLIGAVNYPGQIPPTAVIKYTSADAISTVTPQNLWTTTTGKTFYLLYCGVSTSDSNTTQADVIVEGDFLGTGTYYRVLVVSPRASGVSMVQYFPIPLQLPALKILRLVNYTSNAISFAWAIGYEM